MLKTIDGIMVCMDGPRRCVSRHALSHEMLHSPVETSRTEHPSWAMALCGPKFAGHHALQTGETLLCVNLFGEIFLKKISLVRSIKKIWQNLSYFIPSEDTIILLMDSAEIWHQLY